ncbi:sigma factor [Paenibacillus nanensis]|uniref:sigma factor n=1 Tax=Paenibacillus nanensis TaxID=393251 RepID=UPI001F0C1A0C|nr:sigma factor [Paenibacillus nanensis]
MEAAETNLPLAELILPYHQPIFKYCYHMLRHKQDAEDAAQEVFVKAMRHGRPQSIDMYYENAGDPIQPRIALYISEATGFSSTSRMAPKTEVIQAAQSEVLYEEEHMHVTLVVPHHNNNLQYTIAGNSFTSKEDLLRIAEGILAASEPQASTSQ